MRVRARTMLIMLLLVSVLTVAMALLVAAEEQPVNHILNPGFEFASMTEPTSWWSWQGDQRDPSLYLWDSQSALSGDGLVGIDTFMIPAIPFRYEAWNTLVSTTMLSSTTIRLSTMIRADALSNSSYVELRIHAFRDGVAVGEPCGTASLPSSTKYRWTKVSLVFSVPEGADSLLVQLGIIGQGKVWFDDVELVVDDTAIPSLSTWSVHDISNPSLISVLNSAGVLREPLAFPATPLAKKPWNILMYAAADFWHGYSPAEDFAMEVQSSQSSNVLVFEDRAFQNASIWFADRPTYSVRLTAVRGLGEPDTAEAGTLERFLAFAQEWYPAERTLLFLYGHGHAWWGACNDDSNGGLIEGTNTQDWLTPVEMHSALEAVGGVDAIMFSAPCVMSSLEAVYEVRDVTELYVASEEMSGYYLWYGAIAPIVSSLLQNPDQDMDTFGRTTIHAISDNTQKLINSDNSWVSYQPSIAATATSHMSAVERTLDAFALALIDALPKQRTAVTTAREASTTFMYGVLVDIYHFAEECQAIPGLSEAAISVMQTIDTAVIAQVANAGSHPEAHGLSIYFPVIESYEVRNRAFDIAGWTYRHYGLSLLTDTHWYEFLAAYFAESVDTP